MRDLGQTYAEPHAEPDKFETSTKFDSWYTEVRSCIRQTELLANKIRYCEQVQQEQVSEMVCITKQDGLTRKQRSQKILKHARRFAFLDGELEREKYKPVSLGNNPNKRRLQKNGSARAMKKMKESLVVPMIETIFSLIDEKKQMEKRHLEVEQKLVAANASNRSLQQRINDLQSLLQPFTPPQSASNRHPQHQINYVIDPPLTQPPSLLNCQVLDVAGEGNTAQYSWCINERGSNSSRVNIHGRFQNQHQLTLDNTDNVVTPSMEGSIELSSGTTDVTNANNESERITSPCLSLPNASISSNPINNRHRTELHLECPPTNFPLNLLCDEQRSNVLTGTINVRPIDHFCGIGGLPH